MTNRIGVVVLGVLVGACAGPWVEGGTADETSQDKVSLSEAPDPWPGCEKTPGRPLPGAHGCSALDVAQMPEVILEAPGRLLATARGFLSRRTELRPAQAATDPVVALLDTTARLLPQGNVCEGARQLGAAAKALTQSTQLVRDSLTALQRQPLARGEAGLGDFGARDATFAAFRLALRRIDEARQATQDSSILLDDICRRQLPSTHWRGRVAKIDDVHARAYLEDGTVVGLSRVPSTSVALTGGASVDLTVVRFDDGTGFVEQGGVAPVATWLPDSCLDWRVAPIQPSNGQLLGAGYGRSGLPATASWDPVLEDPAGYQTLVGGKERFLVETGMGIGVRQRLCKTTLGDTLYDNHRISARLELFDAYGQKTLLAWQQDVSDWPVALPALTAAPAQLVVTTYVQSCHHSQPPPCKGNVCPLYPDWDALSGIPPCGPAQQMEQKTFDLHVLARGAFCTAEYDRTVFGLEDDQRAAFEPGHVDSLELAPFPRLASAQFHADGFAPSAPVEGKDARFHATYVGIHGSDAFGVFSYEPCVDLPLKGQSNCLWPNSSSWTSYWGGVTTPAALRWPRAVGTNSLTGKPFAFSCRLPQRLVRDRLDNCTGKEGFFRLPFATGVEHQVSQGNCGCAAGGTCSHACGGAQEFAYDLPHDLGTPIRAARGGRVSDVFMDQAVNCYGAPTWCPGNHIIVEHQDGSFGFYTHMPYQNSYVSVGETVFRGWQLSVVGDTGNASGPHLHFHVTDDPSGYGQTSLVKFELYRDAPYSDYATCVVPASNTEDLGSNNELPGYSL